MLDRLTDHTPGVATTHRLLPDSGVIIVELAGPLRVQDFDALADTADAWIEAHGALQGIVVHAREFPGWQDFDGFLRHIRFVRDHHRNVRRVAVSADGKLADLAPRIARHFVEAEVKHFDHGALDEAVAWAGSAAGPSK